MSKVGPTYIQWLRCNATGW